ncbi:16S rRNA (guanine(527)-N(7))-methyltransferase RsmG [Thalassolituus sp.]|jgi:16S rRNA (guanine527-N7)-methyltransferase|uniref:16S rRNA (guanine(527)-N(7))-methyltransferase RsmG n=1 Tax=Thalassolituus sp. TaxID=2030822 RepID=UPI002A82D2BD|nr:16S rRNA (guanine(527)-N(7))-methyltransferase RsmG [Thalassolituus sp.]
MSTSTKSYATNITQGADAMGIALSEEQLYALQEYLALLQKWNKAYNLTAIRDPKDMVNLHLLDSLAVNPYVLGAKRVIDVGTGPGLPGIILAIMNPDIAFTLLDSNGKKTRFLFQAVTHLDLKNVTIVNDRVEAYHPSEPFDIIVSRAFASLADMTFWCKHLRAEHGHFLAMKGQYPQQEIDDLRSEFAVTESFELQVPGVEGERHILRLIPDSSV